MNVPQHIAIILDGNGRWAKKKGMPRNYGHAQGSKNVERICEEAYKMGVKYLTVYAFSTENWNRPKGEVDALMKLLRNYMKTCLKTAEKNRMKVRVLGDLSGLDDDIRTRILELEEASKNNDGLNFQIAINYGSRDEIVRAVRSLAQDCRDGKARCGSDQRGDFRILPRHKRNPGSGSSDPHKRGTKTFELSVVAACLHRILFYRCPLAGLYKGRTCEGDRAVQQPGQTFWKYRGGTYRCLRQD